MSSHEKSAPGDLEKVRAFVNTLHEDRSTEELPDAAGLRAWLVEQDLIDAGVEVGEEDRRRAVAVREALRALMIANNGGDEDPAARPLLREAAARADLGVTFDDAGSRVEPAAPGVDGALGHLLAIVHEAMRDGTWRRMKACPWDSCHWAFYDHTKNRSGVWCDMEVCGNRAKARAYRQRHAHRAYS